MTPPKLSRRAVAAAFLERQWLDKPRGRRLTATTLADFVSETCGLQIDSVNVIDRAHQITLWSRFGTYDRAALERLTYKKRVLFEYLTHVACFVASRDLALHAAVMADTPARFDRRYKGWRKRYATTIESVEAAIRERGPRRPMANADFERPKGRGKHAGWWDWKPAQHALDFLQKAGRIGVHSRVHFHKRYVAMDAMLPAITQVQPLTLDQMWRERMLRSLAALGAASRTDLTRYWTWPGFSAPAQRATLAALVADGLVSEVAVEGEKAHWFARTEDLPALERAHRKRAPSTGTTLLCPFDSFLWHRERVMALWDYHYRIEIYVPAAQRKHGYYTLPLLHDGHLIGRVDLKTHREDDVLEARHVHFEPWFASGSGAPGVSWGAIDRDAALAGLVGSLRSLAEHVGVSRVLVTRCTPAKLLVPLRKLLPRSG